MAIHNEIILNAWVSSDPKVVTDDEGAVIRASCPLVSLRGLRSHGDKFRHLQLDTILLSSQKPEDAKMIGSLVKGDIIEVKGVISSKNVMKVRRCKECGDKIATPGTIMYVQPIYMEKREGKVPEDVFPKILKKRGEISNHVISIGTLCRDPEINFTMESVPITQYPLAIDRKYRIKEDPVDERTDYIWVKSFGKQADKDFQTLKVGASVFIDGALQTRDVEREEHCEKCGCHFIWRDTAVEIVPYEIEYLQGYNTPEEADEKKGNAVAKHSSLLKQGMDDDLETVKSTKDTEEDTDNEHI